MQGHGCNIRKCPCIARSILSGHAVSLSCSPHNSKCTFEPWWHPYHLFWQPYLCCWGNSTDRLPQTFLLTSNVNTHPPAEVPLLHLLFLPDFFPTSDRTQNPEVNPFWLANFNRILPLPQLQSHPPPAIVSDWCMYFDLISTFFMLNSHDVMLCGILVFPITGKMEESDPHSPLQS